MDPAQGTRLEVAIDDLETGDAASLDRTTTALEQELARIPPYHPERARRLSKLALALLSQYHGTGDSSDLDRAIAAAREAVAVTFPDDPDRAGRLSNLVLALLSRYQGTGDPSDLDQAIAAAREALAVTFPDDPDRAGRLSNLALALLSRYKSTGDPSDLEEAIAAAREAVAVTLPNDADRARRLSNLALAQLSRYQGTGDPSDLEEAIAAAREALAVTFPDDPDRAGRLSNLALALLSRYQGTGDLSDLDQAIAVAREGVAVTFPDDRDRARGLHNLGLALQSRFERAGELADLDQAIVVGSEAVAATAPEDPNRAGQLSNIGIALLSRFERTGELADLDQAIDAGREAVAATAPDNPTRAGRLSNLSVALRSRFERTGELAHLDQAIDVGREALAATSGEYFDRASHLSNLGLALLARFQRTRQLADLDESILVGREAVAATPPGNPNRAGQFSSLAIALQTRFRRTGVLPDLDDAIGLGREAVAATPPDHPDRARRLSNLGIALQARFELTGVLMDLDDAIGVSREAVAVEVASPRVRVVAARGWGHAAAVGGRWQEAVAGFTAAVELLELLATRNDASDQQQLLEDLGGLGSEAAACCIHAGLVDRAVELFEQSRGLLLGQVLDTRTDLTSLAERYPDLAEQFVALRAELDRDDDDGGYLVTLPADTHSVVDRWRLNLRRRREVAEAFQQVIADIRALPGFGSFLLPRSVSELAAAAADGPIVLVNVSAFGSHALVLTRRGVVQTVTLDELTPDSVAEHVGDFLSALDDLSTPTDGERRLATVLGWLWDVVASPVLDRLGVSEPAPGGAPRPRVWWCVSGLLSFLPVHAAGHHHTRRDSVPATVIDRVISSYTPTIGALAYARRNGDHSDAGPGDQTVAVVAMPQTPGAADLPGADAEAALLWRRFRGHTAMLVKSEATHEAVLKALPRATWAHFACHAISDLTDPSASRLLLSDRRLLTAVDVAGLHLENAELAFLSACSTARPGRLTNEAIHLASAFQLAGYRHVITTLWPIDDSNALALASEVYHELPDPGHGAVDAAAALHATTRGLRERWALMPSVWASHIHYGA